MKVPSARSEDCLRAARAGAIFTVDLGNNRVAADSLAFDFRIDPFARNCLLAGIDDLAYILRHEDAITAFEALKGSSG